MLDKNQNSSVIKHVLDNVVRYVIDSLVMLHEMSSDCYSINNR